MDKWKSLRIEAFHDEDFLERFFLEPSLGDDFKKEITQDVITAYSTLDDERCVCFDEKIKFSHLESNCEEKTTIKQVTPCKYAKQVSGLYAYHYSLSLNGFMMFFQGCAYEKAEVIPSLDEEWKTSRKEVVKKVRSSSIPKKCIVCTRQRFLLFHKSEEIKFQGENYSIEEVVKFVTFWFRDLFSRIAGMCRYDELKDASFLEFVDTLASFLVREFPPAPIMLQEWQVNLFDLFNSMKTSFGFFCGRDSVIVVIPGRFCMLRATISSPNSNSYSEISILPVVCEDVGVNNVVILNFLMNHVGEPLKDKIISVVKHNKDLTNLDQLSYSIWLALNSPDYLSEIFSLVKEGGTVQ